MVSTLAELFEISASEHSSRQALEDSTGVSLAYGQLEQLTQNIRNALLNMGVRSGDRVGICLPKSIDSIAAVVATLRSGAAYVPVDASAAISRAAFIFADCEVRVVFVEKDAASALQKEIAVLGQSPHFIEIDRDSSDIPIGDAITTLDTTPSTSGWVQDSSALAYILYTSGSTGEPKGVMLSHQNALSYVNWCLELLNPTAEDRFSSHAPIHFDLSILDIYVPWRNGASLVLIDDKSAKQPGTLARLAAEKKITSWYSTPSVLSLMVQSGKMADFDYSNMRNVIFAGEPFPLVYLRQLVDTLPANIRYLNFYGPTETNVCTYYELHPPIPDERTQPLPIGVPCPHFSAIVLGAGETPVRRGEKGELLVRGNGVMVGYWGKRELTEQTFYEANDGTRWYRTGDIVFLDDAGQYVFSGRRDRMVKKRGYRIELGEIESVLYHAPNVREVAVLAASDPTTGTTITAFMSFHDALQKPSIIAMKQFCSQRIPIYMIPDTFVFLDEIPHTSTDKTDLETLKEMM